MATWETSDLGTEECGNCGSVYEVSVTKLPLRDEDSAHCVVCGNELRSWRGTSSYTYTLIERGDDQ